MREWRCAHCGARLVLRWSEDYPDNWYIRCLNCTEAASFCHEMQIQRERAEADEVLDGLPPAMAALLTKGE